MRLITIFFVLLLASIAMAQDSTSIESAEIITPVEVLIFAAAQDPVRQCMESCISSYDRPGPELRRCVAECQKRRPRR